MDSAVPSWIEVRTQDELDRVLDSEGAIPICVGSGSFTLRSAAVLRAAELARLRVEEGFVEATGSASVHASGSGRVEASGRAAVVAEGQASVLASDRVTVELYESATASAQGRTPISSPSVRARHQCAVEATGCSTVVAHDSVTVTAFGRSIVEAHDGARVRAWGDCTVRARDSSRVWAWGRALVIAAGAARVDAWTSATVLAGGRATVRAHGGTTVVAQGKARVDAANLDDGQGVASAAQWCAYHGVEVADGVAVLYKAVDDNYATPFGVTYAPGSEPRAPDWDDGELECGRGLHFVAQPVLALQFMPHASRFMACPVRVEEVSVHPRPLYPWKVKARGVCAPLYEVDAEGTPV